MLVSLPKRISPFILGSGQAGQAAAKSLAALAILRPELGLNPAQWLPRTSDLTRLRETGAEPLLVISNPHGLHAKAILAAEAAGIKFIVVEKPACVNLGDVQALREVQATVGVLHIYRHLWGPQFLRNRLVAGELGELIAIEGRYWQASAAERALSTTKAHPTWKDDPDLGGRFDAYLDFGSHWVDMLTYLVGEPPSRIDAWLSYHNAASQHRDTHVQTVVNFPGGQRAFGSVSKAVHGAGNQFAIHILGSRGSAAWDFEDPDRVTMGQGRDRRVMARASTDLGSGQSPFHGMGWLEGYIECFYQVIRAMRGETGHYPTLAEHLVLLRTMLQASLTR